MQKAKYCKYCQGGPFNWTRVQGGWRLTDPVTGQLHQCHATRTQLMTKAIELGLSPDVASGMRLRDLQQWIEAQTPESEETKPEDVSEVQPKVAEETKAVKVLETIDASKLVELGLNHVHPNFWIAYAYFKANPNENQWWAGPAGSGKTTLAANVAKALDKTFVHIAISKNTAEFDLFGYMDGHGRYVPGKLYEAIRGENKLVLIDECDRGTDGVLVALNAVLDQRYCKFPNNEEVTIHPSILFVATGNTWGRGADAVYTAAGALDAAFLDRFQFKLSHDYDEKFELEITTNKKWTRHVQRIRKAVFDLRLQGIVISPRASRAGGAAIDAGIAWAQVEKDVIWSAIPVELQASIREKLKVAA